MKLSGLVGALCASLWILPTTAQTTCSFLRDVSLEGLPNPLTLRQYVNDDTVTFELVYDGLAWIGVGYSPDGRMVGNQAVIGLPDDGTVSFHNLGGFSTDLVTPYDDPNLTDASVEQTDSQTILRFTRSTTQDGQVVFAAGEESTIIYAVGANNALGYHVARASASLVFDGCGEAEVTEEVVTEAPPEETVEVVTEAPPEETEEAPVVTEAPPADDEAVCAFQEATALEGLSNPMSLRQYVNDAEGTVTFEVVYQGLGWVGIGYSSDGLMVPNQAVIGLPDEGTVSFYNLSARSGAGVTPFDDPGLTDASIEQTATETILRFTRSVTQDGELVFQGGQESTIIYAVGSSNALGFHDSRSSATVLFNGCGGEAAPPAEDLEVCGFQSETALGGLANGLTLRQYVQDDLVTMELVYDGLAWIGVGYSSDGRMVPNQAVIGLPDEGSVSFYNLAARNGAGVTPFDDPGLTDATIEQTDSQTILRFTRSAIQDGETVFWAGQTSTIIYAVGSGNTLGFHAGRSSADVLFEGCGLPSEAVPEETPAVPAAPPSAAPTTAPLAADGGPLQLSDDVTVLLSADEAAGTVDVEMVYEGLGWVAFGVSPNGQMIGSEAVIGVPGEGVAKYQLSARSVAGVTQFPEEQQTLINADVVQNETHTVLTYTKLLEEDGELPISAADVNTFVYATGPANTLGFHNQRSSVALAIGSNDVQEIGLGTRELWVAHGFMMAVAWGILVPIAIGASLCRDILPLPHGMWFKIHFYTNSLAIVMTLIGFGIAVKAINDETGGGSAAGHFEDPKHRTLGLIIFLLTAMQGFVAFFRPHPPASPKPDDNDDGDGEDPQAKQHHHSTKKTPLRGAWEVKHRLFAVALLGMAWYNVDTGLGLFSIKFEEDDLDAVFWGVLGGILGIILIGYIPAKLGKKKEAGAAPGADGMSEEMA